MLALGRGGTVAAGTAAGATATFTPAPASHTLCSSAPALTFVCLSLSSPLALALALTLIHSSILVLAPCPCPCPHPNLSDPALVCQAPLSLVSVPLFMCLHAPMLCSGSLIVPVYKSKISYHNTLFALTFGI